jgi:hypothetical protein
MELIGVVSVFMKVKRLISFWYWNSKLFVCKDVCNHLCMGGNVHVWCYGQFGFGTMCIGPGCVWNKYFILFFGIFSCVEGRWGSNYCCWRLQCLRGGVFREVGWKMFV